MLPGRKKGPNESHPIALGEATHYTNYCRGEVAEWLNVAVSKTVVRANVPRVRIPLSPPPLVIQTPVKYPAHPWPREIESNWLSFSYTGPP